MLRQLQRLVMARGDEKMKCEICDKPIGGDHISQETKVRLWDKLAKRHTEYHRGCWNEYAAGITSEPERLWRERLELAKSKMADCHKDDKKHWRACVAEAKQRIKEIGNGHTSTY